MRIRPGDRTALEPLSVRRHYSRRTQTETPVDNPSPVPVPTSGRRRAVRRLPLAAASADQRGFLVIYERPGHELNVAEVYELAGMAVVG
jgi:hypothetical protein